MPSSIRGTTLTLALFGKDLSYSQSPALHNTWISEASLDWIYVPLSFSSSAHFRNALLALSKSPHFLGGNITNPFKATLLDDSGFTADARSLAVGACNTVYRLGPTWYLTNTDIDGIFETLDHWPQLSSHANPELVVLGAGGAASAVVWSLRQRWPKAPIMVVCRSALRASTYLQSQAAGVTFIEDTAQQRASIPQGNTRTHRLVVNCLPLGNFGESNPVAERIIREYLVASPREAYYFDLTYGDGQAVHHARTAGILCQDGRLMLETQARASFAIWRDSLAHGQ